MPATSTVISCSGEGVTCKGVLEVAKPFACGAFVLVEMFAVLTIVSCMLATVASAVLSRFVCLVTSIHLPES
jgi:phosphoglycerate-specific signal transduction histidine kinase